MPYEFMLKLILSKILDKSHKLVMSKQYRSNLITVEDFWLAIGIYLTKCNFVNY